MTPYRCEWIEIMALKEEKYFYITKWDWLAQMEERVAADCKVCGSNPPKIRIQIHTLMQNSESKSARASPFPAK